MKNRKFEDFMHEIEAEAEKEGPEAVEQLNDFKEYYRNLKRRWEKTLDSQKDKAEVS